jgi:two-component system nitrate/nitrite response regulator NarP
MPKSRPIEIVIADKSPIVQSGLRALFDGDSRFDLVAVASDGERFLEAVERLSFDVGVIGWEMPYLDGRGVLTALREREDAPKIVVYTGSTGRRAPRDAMTLGAAAFCHKSDPPERLVEAVLAVADGRMVFPFLDLSGREQDPCANLTDRERQLLVALAQGRTNAQLAGDFGISLNTVKFHLKNLYDKLGTTNRAQAVALYLRDCA